VSLELIVIIVTSLIELTELTFVALMAYRMNSKMAADDASLFLQGRRIEDVVREMRESLKSSSSTANR
jgi:hypothetical protein